MGFWELDGGCFVAFEEGKDQGRGERTSGLIVVFDEREEECGEGAVEWFLGSVVWGFRGLWDFG